MGPGPDLKTPVQQENRSILLAALPCLGLTLVLGLLSDGVYHDDDLTHFLMARWARWYPSYLLHIWGRPGLTLPLACVSWTDDADLAWRLARVLSALTTTASAIIAAKLAARMKLNRPWLVVPLVYLQPLATVLACTTLTENFAGLYLVGALLLLEQRRLLWGAVVFSLMLVSRHEAAVFLPLWLAALCFAPASRWRRLCAAVLSLWAPVVHNVLFFAVLQGWPVELFLSPQGSSEYPAEGLLSYAPAILYALGPTIAAVALVGAAALAQSRRIMVAVCCAAFVLTHVMIKATGIFGSGGYGRFLVTIAPLVAILAVAGANRFVARRRRSLSNRAGWLTIAAVWTAGLLSLEREQAVGRLHLPERLRWLCWIVAGLMVVLLIVASMDRLSRNSTAVRFTAASLVLTCLGQWSGVVRPLRLGEDQRVVEQAVQFMMTQGLAEAPFFATDPWFAHYLGLAEDPRAHKDAALLASMPVGTVFVWDSLYSESDYHRLKLADFASDEHYEALGVFRSRSGRGKELHLFRKTSETPLPASLPSYYPPIPPGRRPPLRGIYYVRTTPPERDRQVRSLR